MNAIVDKQCLSQSLSFKTHKT